MRSHTIFNTVALLCLLPLSTHTQHHLNDALGETPETLKEKEAAIEADSPRGRVWYDNDDFSFDTVLINDSEGLQRTFLARVPKDASPARETSFTRDKTAKVLIFFHGKDRTMEDCVNKIYSMKEGVVKWSCSLFCAGRIVIKCFGSCNQLLN